MDWSGLAAGASIATIPISVAVYVGWLIWFWKKFHTLISWPNVLLLALCIVVSVSAFAHYKASLQLRRSQGSTSNEKTPAEIPLATMRQQGKRCDPFGQAENWNNTGLTWLRKEDVRPSQYRNLAVGTIVRFWNEGVFSDERGFHALGIALEDSGTLLMSFCDDYAREAQKLAAAKQIKRVACLVGSPGAIISLIDCWVTQESVTPTATPSETATPTHTPTPTPPRST